MIKIKAVANDVKYTTFLATIIRQMRIKIHHSSLYRPRQSLARTLLLICLYIAEAWN